MDNRRTAATLVLLGAALGALAVATGAFGAHTLAARVPPERLATFETGARYAMYHALALVVLGAVAAAWPQQTTLLRRAGYLFVAGTALFSGSLWLLVLTGVRAFGAITPLGGVCFIAGWMLFAFAAWQQRKTPGSV